MEKTRLFQQIASEKGPPRFKAKTLDNDAADYLKILGFSLSGAGKTYAIKGFLEKGLKVFCASVDIGGSGLRTVKLVMRREGNGHLLKNLAEYEFNSYKDIGSFLDNPAMVDIGGKNIYEWDPDLLAFEGFSNFQGNMLIDHVLDLAPGTKGSTEARMEGLRAELQDWDAIKRGTSSKLDQFLRLHNVKNGKLWHKYVTCHEQEPKENSLTGEITRDPMITGGSRKNFGAAFDVVLQLVKRKKKGTSKEDEATVEYKYIVESNKASTKLRGFKFDPEEEADMGKLWDKMQAQLREG
jgi:hypothetical protein